MSIRNVYAEHVMNACYLANTPLLQQRLAGEFAGSNSVVYGRIWTRLESMTTFLASSFMACAFLVRDVFLVTIALIPAIFCEDAARFAKNHAVQALQDLVAISNGVIGFISPELGNMVVRNVQGLLGRLFLHKYAADFVNALNTVKLKACLDEFGKFISDEQNKLESGDLERELESEDDESEVKTVFERYRLKLEKDIAKDINDRTKRLEGMSSEEELASVRDPDEMPFYTSALPHRSMDGQPLRAAYTSHAGFSLSGYCVSAPSSGYPGEVRSVPPLVSSDGHRHGYIMPPPLLPSLMGPAIARSIPSAEVVSEGIAARDPQPFEREASSFRK